MGLMGVLGSIGKAVLGPISEGIQSSINARTARENTDKTIAANKQLAEYQYSKDLEMWNKGNAYNAPTAQMDRLKSAGLNPNLVYGTGAVGNTTGQLPKYNAPRVEYNYQPPVNMPAMLGSFQDFQIKQAQIDNLKAQRSAIVQNTINKSVQEEILRYTKEAGPDKVLQENMKTRMLGYKQDYTPRMLDTSLQAMIEKNRLMNHQMNLLMQNTEYKRLQNEWFTTQMFGKMGLDLIGKAGNIYGKGLGSAGKVIPKLNQKTPRYNSPTFWRDAGY